MFSKYTLVIGLVLGVVIGGGGTLGIAKLIKPVVKVQCPPAPDCNCPEQKPCQGIDFDKIKSKYITIQNEQHLTVSGDSLFAKKIVDDLKAEMKALKLSKCK
jgi:hypothetical protein